MEACVVVCRKNKPIAQQGRILFINAVNEVTHERAFSFLTDEHINKIVNAYRAYHTIEGFTKVVPIEEILSQDATLNIPMYVRPKANGNSGEKPLNVVIDEWWQSSQDLRRSMDQLFAVVGGMPASEQR